MTGGALIGATAIATPALAGDGGNGSGLVGAWMVERNDPELGTTCRGVFTFAEGGGVVYHDISTTDTQPPVMWTGLMADPAGRFPALLGRVVGTLPRSRKTFTNRYTSTFFFADSGAEWFHTDGFASGTRLDA